MFDLKLFLFNFIFFQTTAKIINVTTECDITNLQHTNKFQISKHSQVEHIYLYIMILERNTVSYTF
jgi:hypothetical protein